MPSRNTNVSTPSSPWLTAESAAHLAPRDSGRGDYHGIIGVIGDDLVEVPVAGEDFCCVRVGVDVTALRCELSSVWEKA
ncbi:hypothetical protein ABH37_11875 [Mycobacterium haemophilum]|uniref:Uncharacterized protein n=1 Tax=Mycobacterium haemophilum TaxID=29311 RepID=A0A0I9V4U0_9MYCO|nr:hypothetical protein ABH39_09325 [Mycobacterium haemophilum]KLO36160.1 hypothetical protein ABH38_13245 [Mycobacterium haemophilum]KLO42009.1 hypothetical protein ABH37_11875 [Mycobacterium haemophilum]KLO49920.1 hypothetical protein ABH36_09795 [Mycobacterium haemophilum]